MPGVYEFTISLKDGFSAIFGKANAAIEKVESAAGKAGKKLNMSVEELQLKLERINQTRFSTKLKSEFEEATREAKKLEKQIDRLKSGISGNGFGSKMKGWRQDFANSLPGADLMSNPLTMAGAAVGGLWTATEKAMEAGKEKMKLQTLTGSQEIGNALYEGLTKYATDTVFGTEVYDMATQMLANGIANADVLPLMKQLGDISMGDAEKLGSLSLAFAQVTGKGHLAGQELLQLVNAGFNPLKGISEKTGEGMDSLYKRMEKGLISVDEVRMAMDAATGKGGKFHNMLEQIAQTPSGQLEQLRGQLEQMMVKIGSVFLPIASKTMTFFSWIGEKFGPLLEPLAAILGGLSVGILAVAAAQWVLNLAIWSNPITWIIAGIVALIALIIYLVSKINGWGNAWKIVINNAKLNLEVFTSGAKLLWTGMIDSFMIGLNKIKDGWYRFKNAVGIGNEAENNAAIVAIANDTKQRADEIVKAKTDFDKKTAALKSGQKNAMDALSWNKDSSVKDTVSGLQQTLGLGTPKNFLGKAQNDDKKQKPLATTAKDKADGIVSGGSKQTQINITIGKLQDQTVIHVDHTEKGLSGLGDKVQEILLRAVNSVNQMQTS